MRNKILLSRFCALFICVCLFKLFTPLMFRKHTETLKAIKQMVFDNSLNPIINRAEIATATEFGIPDNLNHRETYNRIAFLKTHKTGSSTAQNIFLRYGESRNLTFLISKQRKEQYDNVISTHETLNKRNILPPPSNKTYDILCCHVLYNKVAFQKYMPCDAAYISILREPFEQFLSTLNYFMPGNIFNGTTDANTKVLEYLRDPWSYEKELMPYYSFTNNRMAVEFDFPLNLFYNYSKELSMAYIKKLDVEFHLIIILEHFMESVILMRRMLGWTTKDILYKRKNSRDEYSFGVSSTHRHLYKRYARLDYDLYNFFYVRLMKQIQNEGIDFKLELLQFRYIRQEVEDFCQFVGNGSNIYTVLGTKWSEAFTFTPMDCNFLQMGETEFVEQIRKRQNS